LAQKSGIKPELAILVAAFFHSSTGYPYFSIKLAFSEMKKLYAFLLSLGICWPLFSQQNFTVHFQSGAETFPENFTEAAKQPAVSPSEIVNGYYVRYLQCAEIPAAAERAALEAEGVKFLGYVSFGAYLVALPQNFDLKKLEKIRVRSLVSLKNEWKMARNLRGQPFGEWALHGDWLDVNLQVYPHLSIAQGAEMCRREGMTILLEGNQNGFLQVRFLKDKLDEMAALPWVQSLELVPPPSEPDDTRGRALHRSNGLDSDHALGKKFNGDGVSILVRDDGPVGEHIDFQGRLTNLTGFGDNGTHGDGVSGIFAGAGNLDPAKKGMAAGATLYVVRYTPEFQDQTLPLHLQKNVTITNSSYSNGCNAGYTLASQTVDKQIFENPTLMHVFSAGNSNGITTCLSYGAGNQWGNITGGHKMAKNAIAAANLNADATLVASSSRGPAYDGRLKPDIAANGNQQFSTDHNNTYLEFSGTSAAAPGIAGCLAQLTHAFKSLNNGQQPPSALLKVAILNTANDLGNAGPDFKFGWGHVNTARALQLLEENRWLESQVEQGQQNEHNLQIPDGVMQARIMVYWAEPPASIAASKALLNDLDLSVTSVADGSISMPWKLNPTPDPVILDLPAARGRDSLNNVEQVALENPAPGLYTVRVYGAEVPYGLQSYFLAWEFLTDEAKITYPTGGEGFVPGEIERIHWDAFGNDGTFSLRYSTDNGFSWNQIADVSGDQRMYDWQVPNLVSSRVRLQIQRGLQTHTTQFPLSIAPLPTDIQVVQVCPNSMTISWKPAADTLASDVYLLGKKYMEIVGTTSGNSFTIPLQNGGTEQWVSVRASGPNGLAGRRAVAVQWPGELKNCIQPDDLGVRFLQSPSAEADIRCSPFSIPVTVQLKNEGTNAISGAVLNYQANSKPVVSQNLPDMTPGQTISFTFQTPISITENEQVNLKIWNTYAAEDAFFNDTLRRTFDAVAKPVNGYFAEDFEEVDFPPFGWRITNPDNSTTWTKTTQTVTGSNGQPTNALRLNCFSYLTPGEEDYLDLIPADLTGISNPAIAFDLAHVRRNNNIEQLRVEVFPACNLTAQPVVVWEKSDPELSTTTPLTTSFSPNEAGDWRKEIVNLSQYAGQKISVRFVSANGTGNNIFLDNIGIVQYNVSQPTAAFTASSDTVCNGESLVFEAIPTGGNFTNYAWTFGTLSQPNTAGGPGPHTVKFVGIGDKNVRLIASNPLGSDTINKTVKVLGAPSANFSVQLSGLMATFNNSSQNALTYFWDFGDSTFSTLANPTHTYPAPGLYTVRLQATNQCKTVEKLLKVPVTTSVHDLSSQFAIRIMPNPTAGDFRVEIESQVAENEVRLSLFDARGGLVKEVKTTVNQGFNAVSFENLHLPKGIYQLNVQTERGWQGFAVVVQ
jgi:PKD repeat protein